MAAFSLKPKASLNLLLVLILNVLLFSSILPAGAQTEIPELTIGDEFVDSNSYQTSLREDFLLWNKTYIPNVETSSELETVTGFGSFPSLNFTCNALIYINHYGLFSKIMMGISFSNLSSDSGSSLNFGLNSDLTISAYLEFLYDNSSVTPSNMTLKIRSTGNLTTGVASFAVSITQNFTLWYIEATQLTINGINTPVWKYQLGKEVSNPFPSLFPSAEAFETHFTVYYAPSLATIVKLEETSSNALTCPGASFFNYTLTEVRLQSLGAKVSGISPVPISFISIATFFLFYFLVYFTLKRRKKNH